MRALKQLPALGLSLVLAGTAQAQSTPTDYRDEFMRHFEQSSRKLISLSDAIPEDLYTWSPSEGVMPIAQVYMHIARYNYMYPEDALGISPPDGVDLDELESITDKEQVKRLLRQSVEHVRMHIPQMSTDDLTRPTRLYGREVAGWAVLFQLLSHMNEHVGQSVAYARMNGIVPPLSM